MFLTKKISDCINKNDIVDLPLKFNKKLSRQIAAERAEILLNKALEIIIEKPALAQRYFQLARRLCVKYKVKLSKKWRLLICKKCKKLIVPGLNCRVRLQKRREPHLTITCIHCGLSKRIPIKRDNSRGI